MKIDITDPLRAFSHSPGHEAMIPFSYCKVKAFPSALEISSSLSEEKKCFFWNFTGPVIPFTVEQDLERNCLRIYGEAKQGYFRFIIRKEETSILLHVEKTPVEGIFLLNEDGAFERVLFSGEKIHLITDGTSSKGAIEERLFLGNSKHKDWDLIRKRRDLTEILPLWFALGQMAPAFPSEDGPVIDLLSQAEKRVLAKDRSVNEELLNLYLAGFSGGLVPRSLDLEFQGILPLSSSIDMSAVTLLKRGATLIRSLFFQEQESSYYILPCLPSQFVSGKMLGIKTENGCKIDLEWTKHKMRRMTVLVEKEGSFQAVFPSEIKECRLKMSFKDRGRILKNGEVILVAPGQRLWIDRFQK